MRSLSLGVVVLLVTLVSCARQQPTGDIISSVPVPLQIRSSVDYTAEIQPILNARCVVCHSCYNSPCQLKLSSFEGLDRGVTKERVYNSSRLMVLDPTRLFTDAESTEEWREKGFSSVTENTASAGYNNSFLYRFLAHKADNPDSVLDDGCHADKQEFFVQEANWFSPEDEDDRGELACAATSVEVDAYLKKHPNRGMPYGFPPLTLQEFELIRDWLVLGARGEVRDVNAIDERDAGMVANWEEFLNGEKYGGKPERDVKRIMTARYLYEHLFLAHISFDKDGDRFYELVRSETPPGKPISLIGTVRPFDPPYKDGREGPVYYRFRKISSTIVHKTHMVFELNERKKAMIKEWFLDKEWLGGPVQEAAYYKPSQLNPFKVFAQIPPESRYRFLLENNHYTIMTFIRGPVCKGQVALNVVNDHFWLFFMDPEHDRTVQDTDFLNDNMKEFRIPTDGSFLVRMFFMWRTPWHQTYNEDYVEARRDLYRAYYKESGGGLSQDVIWQGYPLTGEKGENGSPALTVFRHFNSASVIKGVQGGLPKTVWVMDFPLMERIYYALVAGFNVYGHMAHQLSTRFYMDGLRQEGETLFLDFIKEPARRERMARWYGIESETSWEFGRLRYRPMDGLPTGIDYQTDNHELEVTGRFVEHIRERYEIGFDDNYLVEQNKAGELAETAAGHERNFVREFAAEIGAEGRFFREIDEEQANIAYVRIKRENAEDKVITMIANRWHDSVRTLFFERDRLNREKDSADFIEDYVGSYPNFLFVVEEDDLGDFYDVMKNFDKDNPCDIARVLKYGINRNNPQFWCHYDWFQKDFVKKNCHSGGIWDLNRYYKVALGEKAVQHYIEECSTELGEFYNDECDGPREINSNYPYPEMGYKASVCGAETRQ